MDYSLAKKLKEKEFPQESSIQYCDECHTKWNYDNDGPNGCNCWEKYTGSDEELSMSCVPTLEEMIEALGDDFEMVRKVFAHDTGKFLYWFAECTNRTGICCKGKTPIEAMANLFIALNEE